MEFKNLMYRSNYDIPFFNQPMMELVGSIFAIRFADVSDSFVFNSAFFLALKVQLDRAFNIPAEFPSFVFDVSVHYH